MKPVKKDNENELTTLCNEIRNLSNNGEFDKCLNLIYLSMSRFPDAPEPHNLLGIILEKTGNHPLAMKHFRAAWALDPTYHPANQNLMILGSFEQHGEFAFDGSDCSEKEEKKQREIVYVGRGTRTEYDRFGIGRLVKA